MEVKKKEGRKIEGKDGKRFERKGEKYTRPGKLKRERLKKQLEKKWKNGRTMKSGKKRSVQEREIKANKAWKKKTCTLKEGDVGGKIQQTKRKEGERKGKQGERTKETRKK